MRKTRRRALSEEFAKLGLAASHWRGFARSRGKMLAPPVPDRKRDRGPALTLKRMRRWTLGGRSL